jgi:pimeloyl-ACP methyl ester carboxylesterase
MDGTLYEVSAARGAVLLVHGGGGVDRHEDGFYARFAERLAAQGFTSLRFDRRCAGTSEGDFRDLTLHGVANDTLAAAEFLRGATESDRLHLVGTSFGGGTCVIVAKARPTLLTSLCLFCPLLDYRSRLLAQKSFWNDETGVTREGLMALNRDGFLPHGSALKMTRPLINEVCFVEPHLLMRELTIPVFTAHGTADSRLPYEISRRFHRTAGPHRLMTLEGADHGFTVPGDDDYSNPLTRRWQSEVFEAAIEWMVFAEDAAE